MLKKLLAVLLLLCTLISVALPLSATADELDDVRQEIEEYKQQLSEYNQKLEDIQSQRDALQEQSSQQASNLKTWLQEKIAIEQDAALLVAKRDTLQKIVEEYDNIIEELEASAIESEAQLAQQIEDMGTLLVELYKNDNASDLELFFKSESYSSYVAHLECMEQLIESSDKQVQEIYATMLDIAKTREEHNTAIRQLSAKKRELVGSKLELAQRDAVLEYLIENNKGESQFTQADIDKKKEEEAAIVEEIEKLKEQLDQMKTEEERLEQQKKEEEMENQLQQKPGAYEAVLQWPIPSAYSYYVSSRYGYRTGTYEGFHNGFDIVPRAGRGTPILAAESGTVIFSGNRGDFGNAVFIDHGNGLTTVYAHCDTLLVEKGAKVVASQTIATVGNTGLSGGDHLHFAVVKNGSYTDPEKYLPTCYTKG